MKKNRVMGCYKLTLLSIMPAMHSMRSGEPKQGFLPGIRVWKIPRYDTYIKSSLASFLVNTVTCYNRYIDQGYHCADNESKDLSIDTVA